MGLRRLGRVHHIDDVDMIVEGPHNPLPSIQTPPASEAETRIAEFVVENMDDGATLQLGIGSLPNAVGQMLAQSDLRDLGIHTEMLCDCYLDMYRGREDHQQAQGHRPL